MIAALVGGTAAEGLALAASLWSGFMDAEGCVSGIFPRERPHGIHPKLMFSSANIPLLHYLQHSIAR